MFTIKFNDVRRIKWINYRYFTGQLRFFIQL